MVEYPLFKKICSICKIEKSVDEFNKDKSAKYGVGYRCKPCDRKVMSEYDKSEKGIKRRRKCKWKKSGINITYDEYVKKYKELEGKCEICQEVFISLCVDHNHENGKVRGLLCTKCNLGIENFKENDLNLFNAINYLRKHK